MKKILLIILVVVLMSCEQNTNTVAKWNEVSNEQEVKREEFKIGDVVKFKHENETLGVVNYIRSDNVSLDVYYRDYEGKINDLHNIKFECIEKVKQTE